MEPRLTPLNFNEVLLYLGYRGQELEEGLVGQIRRCMDEVSSSVRPRLVYRRVPVVDGEIEGLPLGGKDIRELLRDCGEAVVFAATLGSEAELLLRQREVTDMADAVILDSAESVAIENVCNNFQADLGREEAEKGFHLTDRFSPGYGDLPLSHQKDLGAFLVTSKRIGLSVQPNCLMVPRKSVTAIIGISKVPQTERRKGCEVCKMFLKCTYRKEGRTCNG